jgi:N,N'-diacetylchitobiose transport system permease protein
MFKPRWVLAALGAAFLVVMIIFPLYWGVRTSLVSNYNRDFVPTQLTLDNYRYLFNTGNFANSLINSLIVSLLTVALTVPLAVFAGYALARFDFAGKRFGAVLLILPLLPAVAVLVPLILYMRGLGLYNTLYSVILGVTVFSLPFAIWITRGFMLSVPQELEDAARLDGCGPFGILRRIMVPLIGPGLIAVGIFVFITAWNNYIFAFAFTTSAELRVVPVSILGFISAWGTNYGGMNAASTLTMLPPLLFFLLFQKWFTQGILAGSNR